jgi:hypothetical protein
MLSQKPIAKSRSPKKNRASQIWGAVKDESAMSEVEKEDGYVLAEII